MALSTLNIPIAKAGKGVTLAVDSDIINDLSPEIQLQIFAAGLEKFLNSRMSKLPAPSKLEGSEAETAKTEALAKAEENLSDLKAGKLTKKGGAKAKGTAADRAVIAESRRLARELVKNAIRKAGEKISHFTAKQLTEYADQYIEADPGIVEQAKANLAERSAKVPGVSLNLVPDATLVAKAKAKASETLSKTQAGIAKPHKGKVPPARPRVEAQQHTAH